MIAIVTETAIGIGTEKGIGMVVADETMIIRERGTTRVMDTTILAANGDTSQRSSKSSRFVGGYPRFPNPSTFRYFVIHAASRSRKVLLPDHGLENVLSLNDKRHSIYRIRRRKVPLAYTSNYTAIHFPVSTGSCIAFWCLLFSPTGCGQDGRWSSVS